MTRMYLSAIVALCLAIALPLHAEIVFTDVSAEAGLSNGFYESLSKHSLGVTWFDFDMDGLPDILATNGYGTSGPHLYRNLGNGQFAPDDGLLPELADLDYAGVRTADYDGDGDTDVYLYTAHEEWSINGFDNPPDGPPNLLLQNQWVENGGARSEPLFIDVAAQAGVDDCPDLPLGPDYGCYQTRSAVFLDYDLDGCTDLFVSHMVMNHPREETNRGRLYRNLCDGTFEDATEASHISDDPDKWRSTLITVAFDLNGDRCPEIYMGNVGAHPELLVEDYNDVLMKNNCDGTFTEIFENQLDDSPAAMGVDIADFNGDGLFELYITDAKHDLITHDLGNTLYTVRSPGRNRAIDLGIEAGNSWAVHFMDADHDGDEDLFVGLADHEDNPLYSEIFERQGNTFVSRGAAAGLNTFSVRGSAVADYDGDGDLDILLVNQPGALQLFRNDTTGAGDSLIVRLVPSISNPDAFGAAVQVRAGELDMRRQLMSSTSAHSASFPELHFGLGSNPPQSVLVVWPSGIVTEVTDITSSVIVVHEEP